MATSLQTGAWTIVPLPTYTGTGGAPHPGDIFGKKRMVDCRFELAATGNFYPSSGGIPLPTHNATVGSGDTSYGMVRNLDYVIFYGEDISSANNDNTAIVWKYVATDHAIRGFWDSGATSTGNAAPVDLAELPTTWSPSDTNTTGIKFRAQCWGW